MIDSVLGIMVLYKPPMPQVTINIEAALKQVDRVLVVDNTPQQTVDQDYLKEIENLKAKYESKFIIKKNDFNLGLPVSYNFAIEYAKRNNFKFLLLLDQDSNLTDNVVKKLLFSYNDLSNSFKVGAVCAINKEEIKYPIDTYLWAFYERSGMYKNNDVREVALAINSGFMAPLSVYEEVGKYDENYFLDCVDQEMCFRMIRHGYKIFILESAVVNHSEGKLIKGRVLFLEFYVKMNEPIRYYYISRGTLKLLSMHLFEFPSLSLILILSLVVRNLRIISFPSNRFKSWYFTFLGIIHFFKGITGILPES